KGRHAVIKALLREGLNPNCHDTDNRTLLQRASSKGQLDIVVTLLKSQEVLGFDMVPALHAAVSGGHQEIVERLLNAVTNVNAIVGTGRIALQFAALEGHRGIVETLLKAGANVNLASRFDETAFELAVNGNHAEVVRALLKAGAKPN
ncbi:ankyrin repeat-containing domain protein, partial [Trichophaea hybrida]